MYEHYERNRADNLTDPALRRERPISTISGWDRERGADAKTDEAASDEAAVSAALKAIDDTTHSNGQADTPERALANKGEQIDDADVDVEPVTAVGDGDENSSTAADGGADKAKPLSSISNISQVYNEQLSGQTAAAACNGDVARPEDESADGAAAAEQPNEPAGTTGADALRQALEIDGYDDSVEDNKEIVDEIVKEILAKSESALDDCKRELDESHLSQPETTSPVIKDEEIEQAVNEVVKGVRNIELIAGRKEADASMDERPDDAVAAGDGAAPPDAGDNQKTDAANDPDNVGDDIDENAGVALEPRPAPATLSATEEIKEIVTTIVNDVIENCVNKTKTNDVCDNETGTQPINQGDANDDSINNNSSESAVLETTTSDDNDNAIIAESRAPASESVRDAMDAVAAAATPAEETSEDIVKGIVDEIVDKCVEREMNTANIANSANNNDGDAAESVDDNSNSGESVASKQAPTEIQLNEGAAGEAAAATQDSANNSNISSAGDNEPSDIRGIEPNRPQSKSISTSTQVENNHFGNELSGTHSKYC